MHVVIYKYVYNFRNRYKLTPKTLFNFAGYNLSHIIKIKDFNPCLEINPEAVKYLANLSQDELTKFISFPTPGSHYGIDIIFRKNNHKAFVFAKKNLRLNEEKEIQLLDKNEDELAGTNLISSSFFSRSLPSRAIAPKIPTDTNKDTNKPKHKIKTKTHPITPNKPSSQEITFPDEKKSEADTRKVLHITVEEKSGNKTTTSEKKYILHAMPRYAPDLNSIKAVYGFFSFNIKNEKKIRDKFSLYKNALRGKVGNHRCTLKKYTPPKGKKSEYFIKIKLFDSGIEDPGQIRILGRKFRIIEDPDTSNKSIMIIAFDCIQNKKTDNIIVKTDTWLENNDSPNQNISIMVKNANSENVCKVSVSMRDGHTP